jgi:hypothetical protein
VLGSYEAGVALDYVAEVSDQLLPPAEPNERFYRLLAAVLSHLRAYPSEGFWRAATYFTYWAVRLSGFLPEIKLSAESRRLAELIATTPVDALAGAPWDRNTGADLRRRLAREIEMHIERRLVTAAVLEGL